MLHEEHTEIFAYTRTLGDETLLVVTNFSGNNHQFDSTIDLKDAELIISNYETAEKEANSFELRPWEARVYQI